MIFSLNQILNVSPNLQIAVYLETYLTYLTFFNDPEEHEFSLKVAHYCKARHIGQIKLEAPTNLPENRYN